MFVHPFQPYFWVLPCFFTLARVIETSGLIRTKNSSERKEVDCFFFLKVSHRRKKPIFAFIKPYRSSCISVRYYETVCTVDSWRYNYRTICNLDIL